MRNLSLPLGVDSVNHDHPVADAGRGAAVKNGRVASVKVSLPDVPYIKCVVDQDAQERNELLGIAREAQEQAVIALLLSDADRMCSWLPVEQRDALASHMRALNLLALEAHIRASGILPLTPAPLPIRRLCAHMLMWREHAPILTTRLGINPEDAKPPMPVDLEDQMPSQSIVAEVRRSFEGVFD